MAGMMLCGRSYRTDTGPAAAAAAAVFTASMCVSLHIAVHDVAVWERETVTPEHSRAPKAVLHVHASTAILTGITATDGPWDQCLRASFWTGKPVTHQKRPREQIVRVSQHRSLLLIQKTSLMM